MKFNLDAMKFKINASKNPFPSSLFLLHQFFSSAQPFFARFAAILIEKYPNRLCPLSYQSISDVHTARSDEQCPRCNEHAGIVFILICMAESFKNILIMPIDSKYPSSQGYSTSYLHNICYEVYPIVSFFVLLRSIRKNALI